MTTPMCTAPAAATRITTVMTSAAQLTALLHLASPALPVGAFSYSQGLEAAVEARHVHDEASAARWIAEGLAVAYDGGRRIDWCERLRT